MLKLLLDSSEAAMKNKTPKGGDGWLKMTTRRLKGGGGVSI